MATGGKGPAPDAVRGGLGRGAEKKHEVLHAVEPHRVHGCVGRVDDGILEAGAGGWGGGASGAGRNKGCSRMHGGERDGRGAGDGNAGLGDRLAADAVRLPVRPEDAANLGPKGRWKGGVELREEGIEEPLPQRRASHGQVGWMGRGDDFPGAAFKGRAEDMEQNADPMVSKLRGYVEETKAPPETLGSGAAQPHPTPEAKPAQARLRPEEGGVDVLVLAAVMASAATSVACMWALRSLDGE
jgi:hypothetical protein